MKFNKRFFVVIICEFLSALIYSLIGCMGPRNDFYRPIKFGLAATIAMQCFGQICGAIINPAVTIAAVIIGALDWPMTICYLILQFLGALAGTGLARMFVFGEETKDFCCVEPYVGIGFAIAAEFLLTLFWVFAMCAHFEAREGTMCDSVAIRIGLVVLGLHFAGLRLTGPSMNPARSLAAAIVGKSYTDIWVYLIFPPLSGIIVGLLWRFVFADVNDMQELITK